MQRLEALSTTFSTAIDRSIEATSSTAWLE